LYCPKCDGTLEPVQVGTVLVQACPLCGGIWLRYGELKLLFEAWSQGIDYVNAKHQHIYKDGPLYVLNPDQIMGFCPVCTPKTLMLQETRNVGAPIRIDYCQRGHGLWLDAPEIRQIQSRIINKSPEYPLAMYMLLTGQKAA